MKQANVILATEAAREKGCSSQAIYNAIDRGDLNEVRMGRLRMVVKDAKYRAYQVREFGGRLSQAFREKNQNQTEG